MPSRPRRTHARSSPTQAARYFGIAVGERTLVPGEGATLGEIRLDDWLREASRREGSLLRST